MKLLIKELAEITCGAQSVVEQDGYVVFKRFTDEQARSYLEIGSQDYYNKSKATAGVRLSFSTDAISINFDYKLISASSRGFAHIDVFENDKLCAHYELNGVDGSLEHKFSDGQKKVEIYLPWSKGLFAKNVVLKGATFITPVKRSKKAIAFGDSITQGYDAEFPSNTYVNLISRALDADVIDLGIGGDKHFAPIVETMPKQEIDYITVAYGTNDWAYTTYAEFNQRCEDFYSALNKKFSGVKIFTILPIWRKEESSPSLEGYYLDDFRNRIIEITKQYNNISVVGGKGLLPHDTEIYSDKRLHPNDEGFSLYAKNLLKQMGQNR